MQEIGGRRQVDRQTYRFMGFRDQAAAIPRVWSTATFPTPLFGCPPLSAPRNPCRGGIDGGGCKNFTANCLQTRPAARRYDREKQETPGKPREKLVWVRSLLSASVLFLSPPSRSRAPFGSVILSADDDIAAGLVRFGGFRLVLKFYGL